MITDPSVDSWTGIMRPGARHWGSDGELHTGVSDPAHCSTCIEEGT